MAQLDSVGINVRFLECDWLISIYVTLATIIAHRENVGQMNFITTYYLPTVLLFDPNQKLLRYSRYIQIVK